MGDRNAFLQAIVDDPYDNVSRLVYADWLEENMSGDPVVDATIEFIRASCQPTKNTRMMSPSGYVWVHKHWRRIVPSLLTLHIPWAADVHTVRVSGRAPVPVPADRGPPVMSSSYRLSLRMNIRPPSAHHYNRRRLRKPRPATVRLVFWKGFVRGWAVNSSWSFQLVQDRLHIDQPHLVLTHSAS